MKKGQTTGSIELNCDPMSSHIRSTYVLRKNKLKKNKTKRRIQKVITFIYFNIPFDKIAKHEFFDIVLAEIPIYDIFDISYYREGGGKVMAVAG